MPNDTPASDAISSGGRNDPADSASSAPAAAQTPAAKETEPGEDTRGIFKRLRRGLAKTRKLLTTDLDDLFAENKTVDGDMLDNLEEILITADIGVQTATDLMQRVSSKSSRIGDAAALKKVLREEILDLLVGKSQICETSGSRPHVIMVVGVNGVGKTTTIGKLAARFLGEKKRVLIAAADTFRAAAVEQLAIWAERSGADFVRHKDGADPAAVAYDGIEAARARNADVVLVDTAGRLHTKINLMEELKKIKRSIAKIMPDAPHEVLLVLDATTGQNALSQAKLFNEALGSHRHCPDKTGRHRQRRYRDQYPRQIEHSAAVRRGGRDDRRPSGFRSTPVCRRAFCLTTEGSGFSVLGSGFKKNFYP